MRGGAAPMPPIDGGGGQPMMGGAEIKCRHMPTNTIIYLASVNGYSVIGQSGVLFLVHMLHIAKRGEET